MEHECCNLAELEKLRKENEQLKGLLKTIRGIIGAQSFPFICGAQGEPGGDGLADGYLICPAYGSDIVGVYKKVKATNPEF
jgi:hypothetical protein